jgi:hypothetical protein
MTAWKRSRRRVVRRALAGEIVLQGAVANVPAGTWLLLCRATGPDSAAGEIRTDVTRVGAVH